MKILPSCLSSSHETQTNTRARGRGTACAAYHGALRTAVLEAAGFFVEAVVGSRGFGHLLHDRLRFHVLLCSRVYRDVSSLKQARKQKKFILTRVVIAFGWPVHAPPRSLFTCGVCWYDMNGNNPTMPAACCIVF